METTFENARVGDKVWSFEFGWGEIIHIYSDTESNYPVKVNFEGESDNGCDVTETETYTTCGRRSAEYKQSLFWDEIKFDAPKRQPRKVTKYVNLYAVKTDHGRKFWHNKYVRPGVVLDTIEEAQRHAAESTAIVKAVAVPIEIDEGE